MRAVLEKLIPEPGKPWERTAKFCAGTQGAESRRAANAFGRRAETAQNSLFWLDQFVCTGVGWLGMRGAQTDCESATDTAYDHASGYGRIREALDGCARNSIESSLRSA